MTVPHDVPDDPRAAGPADRRLLRIPSSVFSLLGVIVLFALGRQAIAFFVGTGGVEIAIGVGIERSE